MRACWRPWRAAERGRTGPPSRCPGRIVAAGCLAEGQNRAAGGWRRVPGAMRRVSRPFCASAPPKGTHRGPRRSKTGRWERLQEAVKAAGELLRWAEIGLRAAPGALRRVLECTAWGRPRCAPETPPAAMRSALRPASPNESGPTDARPTTIITTNTKRADPTARRCRRSTPPGTPRPSPAVVPRHDLPSGRRSGRSRTYLGPHGAKRSK